MRLKFIGFPDLQKVLGAKEFSLDVPGDTFGDLLEVLYKRYGEIFRRQILDGSGSVNEVVQVLKNDKDWISRSDLSHPLRDGDKITFLLMVAGG